MSSTRELAETLLQGVAADLGTPLEFDEGGGCTIERDGGQEMSLQVDEASNSLMLYAPLLSAGHRNREALFAWLLELNLLDESVRGAVIGLDRTTNMLAIRYRLPLEGANPSGLSSILVDLFATVDEVVTLISEFQQNAGAESSPGTAYTSEDEMEAAELPHGPAPNDFA